LESAHEDVDEAGLELAEGDDSGGWKSNETRGLASLSTPTHLSLDPPVMSRIGSV
jgi:hypothetical protein